MPIQQSKKQDDLEKRLKLLRSQVYGRSFSVAANQTSGFSVSISQDTSYLYKDLFKILILASLAIGFQIALFVATKAGLVNLNF